MSDQGSRMSMDSLMEAIYGDHRSEYVSEQDDHSVEQIPDFMQSLIDHLIQLCVTQGFADNVNRILKPWIKDFMFNQKNPRPSIEGFLRDFIRLFHQQTQKINKYGEKKLKYLTQTVSRQIFTQIMRMACDLKLQSVNRANYLQSEHRRMNNLTILVHSINNLFYKDKSNTFKYLKKIFYEEINKEEVFVNKFMKSINKLQEMQNKKNRDRLWKAMSLWRKRNIQISQQQSITVYEYAYKFFRSVLLDMVKSWNNNPLSWVGVMTDHLQKLVVNVLGALQGTVVQFIPNPNIHDSSLDYSALSSYRSGISHMSAISMGECLKNDEIKYDSSNRYVAIPIIAQQQIGVIKISWLDQLPIIFFNRVLRLVELIKSLISEFAKISTRLAYYNLEYENNSWHQDLFQLAFKEEILQPAQIEKVIAATNILFLQIYHERKSPNCCIRYGKQFAGELPQNIYKFIWDKLQTTSSFELERDTMRFSIMKLENEEGFCRYSFQSQQNNELSSKANGLIVQCLVSLMVKNLGKIGCSICNITVKQCLPSPANQSIDLINEEAQINLDSKYMMLLKNSKNMTQAECAMFNLIKASFSQTPLFARIFYSLDQFKNLYAYRNIEKEGLSIKKIQIPKSLINENFLTLQWGETDKNLSNLTSCLHNNPLFENSQVYLYQNQRKNKMKIIAKRVGRKAILVVSTYAKHSQNQILEALKLIGTQVQQNPNLFQKKDICSWSSQILYQKQSFTLPSRQMTQNLLQQVHQLRTPQIFAKLCKNFKNDGQFLVWKVKGNKISNIANNIGQFNNLKLPYEYLSNEPVQSHQSIKGCHRIIRTSKTYGNKLQHFLSYIPNFESSQEKLQYAEAVAEKVEGQSVGQLTDPCYNAISNYLIQSCQFDKYHQQFLSVPVHYDGGVYIFMMIFNRDCYISADQFQAISSNIQRTVPIILSLKQSQMKIKKLECFAKLAKDSQFIFQNKIQNLKHIISKFYQNFVINKHRHSVLGNLVSKLKYNELYKELKEGLTKIKQQSLHFQGIYERNCEVIIKRITKICGYSPFFAKIRRLISFCNGCKQLFNTLQSILKESPINSRVSYRLAFDLIRSFAQNRSKSISNSKQLSLKIMSTIFIKIYNHNICQYFTKSFQNIYTFQRSLKMLKDQFQLLEPKSMKSCLQFLSGRLNLMLSQCFSKPITLSIVNYSYSELETEELLNIQNLLHIQNTKFGILINDETQILKKTVFKYVEPTLSQILPAWQINFRRHQHHRFRIMYDYLQSYRRKNMKYIFNTEVREKNKENIQQFINIRKRAKEEKQKMNGLEKICNMALNLQNRERHKKEMDELKHDTNTVINSLHQVGVEARIKSKTNAAYRMLTFINKRTIANFDEQNSEPIDGRDIQLKEIQRGIEKQRYRFICESILLWQSVTKKVMERATKRNAEQFLTLLHTFSS